MGPRRPNLLDGDFKVCFYLEIGTGQLTYVLILPEEPIRLFCVVLAVLS